MLVLIASPPVGVVVVSPSKSTLFSISVTPLGPSTGMWWWGAITRALMLWRICPMRWGRRQRATVMHGGIVTMSPRRYRGISAIIGRI